jgi:hypothetical protein
MKHIEFTKRYYYYQELLSRGYLNNFSMLSKLIDLYPRIIKWAKMVSADEQKFDEMRKLASELGNSGNALLLSDTIVRIASNYNNLILPLINSMDKGSFQELSLDMMAFSILRNLTEKQDVYI